MRLLGVGTLLAGGLAVLAGTAAIGARAPAIPNFGNPAGRFPVPAAARAVDTRHPDRVVGSGSPATCTSAAVVRAVAAGGIITFDCGPKPVTIEMASPASVNKTRHLVVLDGGGLITLSGGGKHRILFSDTCLGPWSTDNCTNQPYPQIVVQNITFANGFDDTPQATCTDNRPECWFGGVNGGGAIYAEGGRLKVVNSRFTNNGCHADGPDLGGGAIRALVQYENRPVYITGSSFRGGRCSNGGALSSISVDWVITNSVFTGNHALGWGANPADDGTPGGGSGGAIYMDGQDDRLVIAGSVLEGNTAREGGGAIFDVVNVGSGSMTLNQSRLRNNVSGKFETSPGIYFLVDGSHRMPELIGSTVG